MDLACSIIKDTQWSIRVVTDTGTGYTEYSFMSERNEITITKALESIWICKQGSPEYRSGEDEINRGATPRILSSCGISFKPRQNRRHSKTGIVERKIGISKTVLEKLDAGVPKTVP